MAESIIQHDVPLVNTFDIKNMPVRKFYECMSPVDVVRRGVFMLVDIGHDSSHGPTSEDLYRIRQLMAVPHSVTLDHFFRRLSHRFVHESTLMHISFLALGGSFAIALLKAICNCRGSMP